MELYSLIKEADEDSLEELEAELKRLEEELPNAPQKEKTDIRNDIQDTKMRIAKLTSETPKKDSLRFADHMCGFIADLFNNEAENFRTNDESLYDWCEGGDSFRNAGIAEEDCVVLDKMLMEINPKIQEINAIIAKYIKED